jgi:hypothetical protein
MLLSSTMARRSHFSRFHVVAAFFVGCCVGSLFLTVVHISHLDNFQQSVTQDVSVPYQNPLKQHQQQLQHLHDTEIKEQAATEAVPGKNGVGRNKPKRNNNIAANHDNVVHPVAGLHCEEHGGPSSAVVAEEMVYWRDIPQDTAWKSPFLKTDGTRQYLTFEPDGGGWNNIRMRCVGEGQGLD